MPDLLEQLRETTAFIRQHYPYTVEAGIVLGSGLGDFEKEILVEKELFYKDIPHFPISTVAGHKGKLIFGRVSGKPVVAMLGRFHSYEGYTNNEITFPIRLMKYLGIKCLFLSNAAGAVNEQYKIGDLVLIKDHISFAVPNPLVGKNYEELGPRFPDMLEPYDLKLLQQAKEIAQRLSIPIHEGVYFVTTGPTFETPAEYRLIKILEADLVGMSTVQENIVARHMGLPVFAVSVVTDLGFGTHGVTTHEEVLKAASAAEPKLSAILKALIATLQ